MIFPKSEATVHDTWNTRGLRATGSYDFEVKDIFVPEERTVWTYGDAVKEPGPLYAYSMVLLFACGFASVALGVARAGLDAFIDFAGGKLPRGDRTRLADKQVIQSQVGAAEMKWRSGRYGLHGAVREVWDRVSATGRFEIADRVALRGRRPTPSTSPRKRWTSPTRRAARTPSSSTTRSSSASRTSTPSPSTSRAGAPTTRRSGSSPSASSPTGSGCRPGRRRLPYSIPLT